MNKQRKYLIYALLGGVLVFLMMGEDEKKTYWNDRLLPTVELRCLNELSAETLLTARQNFCRCVSSTFERKWKTTEAFHLKLAELVPPLKNLEASMRSRDFRLSRDLNDSDYDLFQRDLLIRFGLKWTGAKFEKLHKALFSAVDEVFESSKKTCVKSPKS
jgi:hypothetical protein